MIMPKGHVSWVRFAGRNEGAVQHTASLCGMHEEWGLSQALPMGQLPQRTLLLRARCAFRKPS